MGVELPVVTHAELGGVGPRERPIRAVELSRQTQRFLQDFTVGSVLLKLASRCNIACSYCYWFADPAVFHKPAVLTLDAEDWFLRRLEVHITSHGLRRFDVCFHGGEPLLFGKARFAKLCARLRILESRVACRLRLRIQTNGMLLDADWARLFRIFRVSPSLSIDGPAEIHDRRRVTFGRNGTHAEVIRGLAVLRSEGLEPGVLTVCSPETSAKTLCEHLINELGIVWFDVLIPDATHHDPVPNIAPFYQELFDLWYDELVVKKITIRVAEDLYRCALGRKAITESFGYGPLTTFAIVTDGSFETCDVFHSVSQSVACAGMDVCSHSLQDVTRSLAWLEALNASLTLCTECNRCVYRDACGGGYVPNRWADDTRFDNPSSHCASLKAIFQHVARRLLENVSA